MHKNVGGSVKSLVEMPGLRGYTLRCLNDNVRPPHEPRTNAVRRG